MELIVISKTRKDRAPWLLLPCALLALSGVTLLAPRQAAQAAPPAPSSNSAPMGIGDDGDGDELLEHWGDPKYAREERLQMAGMAAGFFLAGGLACRGRIRRRARAMTTTVEEVTDLRKAA